MKETFPVSILWYGEFSPAQKSIIADFLLSLNPQKNQLGSHFTTPQPSVSKWWHTIQTYMKKAGKGQTRVFIASQFSDKNCSLGKILKKAQVFDLANQRLNSNIPRGLRVLTLVLTAKDVAAEGFCMSNCGFHGSNPQHNSAFIWVGNSVTQCPGQCAWPFHQPIYGTQTAPLGLPNATLVLMA